MIRYFILFAGFALLAATPAAAHPGEVEVIRGAEIQAGPVAKSAAQAQDPAGIQVLRGVERGARSPERAEAGRHHRPRLRVEAGELLWLVDGAGERVTACRLRKTAMVGRWEVLCYDGDPPAGTY